MSSSSPGPEHAPGTTPGTDGRRAVERDHWLAVLAATAGICAVVTAEQLPIGLLTQIGDGLHRSPGALGLLVTVPGLVAAVAAPLVPLAVRRLDRRLVLVSLMTVLTVANVVSTTAPNFLVLMVARVFVGVTIGGFWAMAAGLAVRLVTPGRVSRATALIFGGVAAGNVFGTPASTLLGGVVGWRPAFAALAGFTLLIAVVLGVGLPRLAAEQPVRLGTLAQQARRPAVLAVLLTTVVVVVGQFGAFTYISPIVQHAGISAETVGLVLVGYGLAGIAGNTITGAAAGRSVTRAVLGMISGVAVALVLVALFATSPVLGVVTVVLWGLAWGGGSVSLQSWTLAAAPDAVEAGTSLWVAAFNLSIAVGALVGGPLVDASGVRVLLIAAAVLVAVASAPVIVAMRARAVRPVQQTARVEVDASTG